MKTRVVSVLIGLLAVVACAGSADDPTGTTWELTMLEGAEPIEGTVVDMTIANEAVSGNAGCNTFNGAASVNVDDNTMTLGPDIISTMMACEDAVNEQEQRFLDALLRVTSYEMANDTLTLLDADGIALATFE